MVFDNAWAILGAETGPDVARVLAYAATSGAEGVVGAGDLKISAQPVPNGTVRMAAGAGVALNSSTGGTQQSYVLRNGVGEPNIAIAPTGAGGARSDLVISRVEDPQYSPWQKPDDVLGGPYVFTRVISGVNPALTFDQQRALLPYPCIILGRIDIPVSTGTITDAMITDGRRMANPRTESVVRMGLPAPGNSLLATSGIMWPDYRPNIYVPRWANYVSIVASFVSMGHRGGNARGVLTATLGGFGIYQVRAAVTPFDLDALSYAGERVVLMAGGSAPVQAPLRGSMQPLGTDGYRSDVPSNGGYLITVSGTQIIYQVQFSEEAQ